MTQLNLSGRNLTAAHGSSSAVENGWSIRKQTIGALGALVMFAAVMGIGSCSRESGKPAVTAQPAQSPAPAPNSALPTPTPEAEQAKAKAKAKTKTRRTATRTYVNREYGIAFSFPRQYILKSGEQTQSALGELIPFQTNFSQAGGITLAGVEVPAKSYPDTDFKSAFVAVSVHPDMTLQSCGEFAFPVSSAGVDASGRVLPAKVKIGEMEFSEIENSTNAMMQRAESRYYHAFRNRVCYEFALSVGTEDGENGTESDPVDHQAVFSRLEKVLATVKFKPAAIPETEAQAPPATEAVPDHSATIPESPAVDQRF